MYFQISGLYCHHQGHLQFAAWLLDNKFSASYIVLRNKNSLVCEERCSPISLFNASLYQICVLNTLSGSDQASKDSAVLPLVILKIFLSMKWSEEW